ncbi:MAG: ABC transporter permease subunit [Verrucomicrobiales bacterium]|jgi:ABC-2 type transport system permease protein|nr:ABC transporter permease subunit [Verrucomicrobiales bacterium]
MTRAFWVLLQRELGAIFLSPVSHVIFALFNLVMGFSFWFCAAYMAQGARNVTIMQIFFMIFYFWFCLIIMIPIFTMRLFAEEYRSGTIELLMSAPVLEWDVILSKFFASVALYAGLWLPTLVYLWVYQALTRHQVPVEWGALGASYLLVLVIGLFYVAIGLFTSSLTRNQVLAAFASFVIIALLFFTGFLGFTAAGTGEGTARLIDYLATLKHMQTFAGGVFDTRPLVFYLSGTGLFLFLTYVVISLRKLRS